MGMTTDIYIHTRGRTNKIENTTYIHAYMHRRVQLSAEHSCHTHNIKTPKTHNHSTPHEEVKITDGRALLPREPNHLSIYRVGTTGKILK